MGKKIVTLDVREDIKRGREPFSKIMQIVAGLKKDEDLLLIAPFEPTPLFAVLAQQGFSYEAKPAADGGYEVLFARNTGKSSAPPKTAGTTRSSSAGPALCSSPSIVDVDARGLEPPQPLVKILEALVASPDGTRLRVRTDRRPIHLYPQLEARGFEGQTEMEKDGSFVTYIDRRQG